MTTHPSAPGKRAISLIIAGALVLGMLQTAAPAHARATSPATTATLQEGTGMSGSPSTRVLAVQGALRRRGYSLGAPGVDGRFGPLTAAAVRRFQARSGLTVDGVVGRKTRAALTAVPTRVLSETGPASPRASVRHLQRVLQARGFDVGAPGVDGRFGPLTAAAVRRMQHYYGLTPDGIVGAKTRRLIDLIAAEHRISPAPAHDHTGTAHRAARRPTVGTGNAGAAQTPRRAATTPPTTHANEYGGTAALLLSLAAALLAGLALSAALVRTRRTDNASLPSGLDPGRTGHSDSAQVHGLGGGDRPAPVAPADDASPDASSRDDERSLIPWCRADDIEGAHSRLPAGEPVIGYVTVQAEDAGRSRSGTREAVQRIESVCAAAGWDLHDVVQEDEAEDMLERPGLSFVLDKLAADQARGLVVSDGRHLTSSMSDLVALLEWFREVGATLVIDDIVALDLELAAPEPRTGLRLVLEPRRSESSSRGRKSRSPETPPVRRTRTS